MKNRNIKTFFGAFFCLFTLLRTMGQSNHTLYMLHGLGSDARIFKRLDLKNMDTIALYLPTPYADETMEKYAQRLVNQIDTTRPFSLLGVSFGGMVAVELGKILKPTRIFLVSSAKTAQEIPMRYHLQRHFPIYKWLGGHFMKKSSPLAAQIFEPAMRPIIPFFKSMVMAKDPRFMTGSLYCIVHWQNTVVLPNVRHIHGSKDNTLPIRRIENAAILKGASHWLIYLNADAVSKMINEEMCKV